jgi:hypothetical protein
VSDDPDAAPNKLWWLFPLFVLLGVLGTGFGLHTGLVLLLKMMGK